MALPLVIRKNIRDNEVFLRESLEKINNATGKEFEFEADWGTVVSQLEQHSKDRIGELYQKDVMKNLADNIEKLCKNETSKEAFYEATSANKIIVKVNDKIPNYWKISFENGALVVEHKKSVGNLYEISNFNIIAVMPVPGVLSLTARLNIQQNQEALQEHLQTITTASGEDFSFDDSCLETLYKSVEGYAKDKLGELIMKDAMNQLATNIKKRLEDDMVKEAFNEVTTSHQITFRADAKAPNYWAIKFENGNLVVIFKPNVGNMYELGNFDFEKLL